MFTENQDSIRSNSRTFEVFQPKSLPVPTSNEPRGSLRAVGAPADSKVEIGDYLTLGAEPSNGIQILGEGIAPHHARIETRGQDYLLRDQRTPYGTFVNEVRVLESILSHGDIIKIGPTEFHFEDARKISPLPNELVSKNAAFASTMSRLPSIAQTKFSVLLNGPSGCGKEVVAKALHSLSLRRDRPFVSVNCSALQSNLIESELFGHIKGSYTGATHDRKGAFEAARGGTLFLDEIGDLPMELQPKLLRALENNEIRPVGSDRTLITDIRLICATHKNLKEKVKAGEFREDLYHRINVVKIEIPSLSARPEDLETHIINFSKKYKVRFSLSGIRRLQDHSWPGNLRELKNVVARLSALYPGEYIQDTHIDEVIEPAEIIPDPFSQRVASVDPNGNSLSVIKEIERELITQRLIANSGNQRKTAMDLGMPKSTLHDRLKLYKIDIGDFVEPRSKRRNLGLQNERLEKDPNNASATQTSV